VTGVLRTPLPRGRQDDSGFTLVELMMVTVLMSVLGALSLTAFVNYQRAADLEGTADDVVSVLRTTAQRSVTEGRTYCVRFDTGASTYTVYRSTCGASSTVAVPTKDARGPAVVSSPSFAPADPVTDVCPTGDDCAYFYPRGTGSPGSVVVQRPGGKSITVTIEGLTSRVVRS
jgi:prepilin-type N-terminal cleavage/methylation domain-containing protein